MLKKNKYKSVIDKKKHAKSRQQIKLSKCQSSQQEDLVVYNKLENLFRELIEQLNVD